eukprot:UN32756
MLKRVAVRKNTPDDHPAGFVSEDSEERHRIACCSGDSMDYSTHTCYSNDSDGCGNHSFEEAEAYCEAQGDRLCTKMELDNNVCCGAGCSLNGNSAWSSTGSCEDKAGNLHAWGESYEGDCEHCDCTEMGEICFEYMCGEPLCTEGQYIEMGDCGCGTCVDGCMVEGDKYEVGAGVPSDSPCEECYCDVELGVVCATQDCEMPMPCGPGQIWKHPKDQCCGGCQDGCEHNGKDYEPEQRWNDGPCTECECTAEGTICVAQSCMYCPEEFVMYPAGEDECCGKCSAECYEDDECEVECAADMMECADGTESSRDPMNDCKHSCAMACTEDAKMCNDGVTYVSRDPENNCEWKMCPEDYMAMINSLKYEVMDLENQLEACEAPEVYGCCFTMGFGGMMIEVGHARTEDHGEMDMIAESDCEVTPPNSDLVGGGTFFEPNVTCEERFAKPECSGMIDQYDCDCPDMMEKVDSGFNSYTCECKMDMTWDEEYMMCQCKSNMVWDDCGSCINYCGQEPMNCAAVCMKHCQCPDDMLWDEMQNACVLEENCVDMCDMNNCAKDLSCWDDSMPKDDDDCCSDLSKCPAGPPTCPEGELFDMNTKDCIIMDCSSERACDPFHRCVDDIACVTASCYTCEMYEKYFADEACHEDGDNYDGDFFRNTRSTFRAACCEDDGEDVTCHTGIDGQCFNGQTWSDAYGVCAANNMRLCTMDEFESGICCDKECRANDKPFWTGTPEL